MLGRIVDHPEFWIKFAQKGYIRSNIEAQKRYIRYKIEKAGTTIGGACFFYFRPDIPFLGKFDSKNLNCQFMLKFAT